MAVAWRVRRGRGTEEREAKTWLWPDPECTHLGAILRVQVLAHGYSEKGFVQGQERLMFQQDHPRCKLQKDPERWSL